MKGHYYAAEAIDRGEPVVITRDDRAEPGKLFATPWIPESQMGKLKQPDGVALTDADGPGDGGEHDLVTVKCCL